MNTKKIVKISFLSVLLTICSFIKFPGLIPGTQFQISAPIAVSICSIFGFKIYILAGIISSITTFILGTHNLISILNSFIFRVIVGLVLYIFKKNIITISIAGPIGSIVSRFILSFMLKTDFIALLTPSIPGIIYTLFTAYPATLLFKKILKR